MGGLVHVVKLRRGLFITGPADGRRCHCAQSRFGAIRGGQTRTARHHGAQETRPVASDPHQPGVLPTPEPKPAQTRMGRMEREDEGPEDDGRRDVEHGHHDDGQRKRRELRRFDGGRRTQFGHRDHHHVDHSVPDVPVHGHWSVPRKPMSVVYRSTVAIRLFLFI